ncbi:MAG: hypothetical protein HGA33_01365 [Candidatus Moranbacteria bacterium]|nr:hypothetical protein [Candidatus Moranbacteria bacterium]
MNTQQFEKRFEKIVTVSLIPKPRTDTAVLTLTGERLRYPYVLLQILVDLAQQKANEGSRLNEDIFLPEKITRFSHSESEVVVLFDLPSTVSEALGSFKETNIVIVSTAEENGVVLGWRYVNEDSSSIRSLDQGYL